MFRLPTTLWFPLIAGLTSLPSTAADPNGAAARRVVETSNGVLAQAATDVSAGSAALDAAQRSFARLVHADVVAGMVLSSEARKESTAEQRREVGDYVSQLWLKQLLGVYRTASPGKKARATIGPATFKMWREKDSQFASRRLEVLCWWAKIDPPCHSVHVQVQLAAGEPNGVPINFAYELISSRANHSYQIADIRVMNVSLLDSTMTNLPRDHSLGEALTLLRRWADQQK